MLRDPKFKGRDTVQAIQLRDLVDMQEGSNVSQVAVAYGGSSPMLQSWLEGVAPHLTLTECINNMISALVLHRPVCSKVCMHC